MSVTLSTAARNAAANAIAALVDAGAGAGQTVLRTVADAEVATIVMSDPAFGSAASGVVTANSMTADSNATGGTATKFTLEDSTAAVVLTGTVGLTGADMNLSSTAIGAGDTVTLTSFTITMPAS